MFGATWCGWCRKLAADTLASPVLDDRHTQFLWLKIDVDEHSGFAARYGVAGLPHSIVTDAAGNVIGEKAGYLPATEYLAFLEDTLRNPQATLADLTRWLADAGASDIAVRREAVQKLLKHVSRVEGTGRDQAIAALREQGPRTWGEVAAYLDHPRLAMRAAAAGLLQRATFADREFDPFGDLALRTGQSRAWAEWIEGQGGAVPQLSFIDWDADASAWSLEGNADRPPAPPLAQPLETSSAP